MFEDNGLKSLPWDFVPAAFCISLIERDDRAQSALEEFRKVGLDDKVTFYRPQKCKDAHVRAPGKKGCWESHRYIALRSLRKGYPFVLVFEDDVEFDASIDINTIDRIRDILSNKLPDEWFIFYLGHFSFVSLYTWEPDLCWTISCGLHAYFMSRRMMEWLAGNPYEEETHDRTISFGLDAFVMTHGPSFAFYPAICFQKPTLGTDNHRFIGTNKWITWSNSERGIRFAERFSVVLPTICIAILVYLFLRIYGHFRRTKP
jgi:GR25 family glycosyltransferase involved in LPS biosynthesis